MFDIQNELKKRNLTEERYEKMLDDFQAKTHHESDYDWIELSEKWNLNWSGDACRKSCQMPLLGSSFVKQYYEEKYAKSNSSDKHEYIDKLEEKRIELEKEKIKLRDERNEYNKIIRQQARRESFKDLIKRIILEEVKPLPIITNEKICNGNTSLLVSLTDIHTGIEVDHYLNTFNQDVLENRLKKYTEKIIKIGNVHSSTECHIVIGEIISGLIHNNLRLQNNMNIIEQFKYISELITNMLISLSLKNNNIYVYITPGNHSRITPNKNDSLDGENMDVLLPFYLKARLQNFSSIHIMENEKDPEIAMFKIRNSLIYSSHGHKDSPESVVQNLTMLYGDKPDIVLLGHRHTNGMKTVFDTKVISSGSVSGADEYALSIRKATKAEQTVSVIDDDGFVCLYDIQLS